MTKKEHIKRHQKLHRMLDELMADMIEHTGRMPGSTTVFELMAWSHSQTLNPTERQTHEVQQRKMGANPKANRPHGRTRN